MGDALQYVVNGIATGILYSLVALGIVILYRTSRILNFAHGDMGMFIACCAYSLLVNHSLPPAPAFLISLVLGAVLGGGFYLLVLRAPKDPTLLGQITTTLGFSLVLSGGSAVLWGTETRVMPFPLSDTKVYSAGGVALSELSGGSFLASAALMAALYVLIQHTKVGLAMRAISQDHVSAQILGIPSRRVLALSWALSGVLAGSAGILLSPVTFVDPYMMLDPFLKGFACCVLGGMDSPLGAVLGGILLGVAESLFGGYISVAFKTTFAFGIIILVLALRPEGLFGREFKRRV